ncbi:MAG: peptidoglycan editing factor PgeF [Ignavibacteriae bacterium HGW-Ignavibacteriae-2]|jgi:hypothetical protein|nr:MAG: peptidoglycan editing factor PgeF [Ignavibacteriae bacterium HGW-Ignavibacteriae-2]
MIVIESSLLGRFKDVKFGFSTKIGLGRNGQFDFNLSYSVGDDPGIVTENRKMFIESLGLSNNNIAFQKQIHSDIITIVDKPGVVGESDGLITNKSGIGLAVTSADCTPIFIYDRKNKVIAAVHSGWRGTEKQILFKTLEKMKSEFGSEPENLFAYIGPSISKANYEVGAEVATLFDDKFLTANKSSFHLDVSSVNLDYLLKFGLPKQNIQHSRICSYGARHLLHSYRRDGAASGRALGIIALMEN